MRHLMRHLPGCGRWCPMMGPSREGHERGSGTVLGLAVAMVLLLGLAAVAVLSQAAAAAGRAATAADLAALAGADAARGLAVGDPCAAAADVTARHSVRLVRCERSGAAGLIVDVWTAVPLPGLLPLLTGSGAEASGRARAGPPP